MLSTWMEVPFKPLPSWLANIAHLICIAGGSSVSVGGGVVTSYPSDTACQCPWPTGNVNCKNYCVGNEWAVERKVTTILCAHLPRCTAYTGCGNTSTCQEGRCVCNDGYEGEDCHLATTTTTTTTTPTTTTTTATSTPLFSRSTAHRASSTSMPAVADPASFAHWRTAVAVLAVFLVVLICALVLTLRGRRPSTRVAWTVSSEPTYTHLAGDLLADPDEEL
eukprot:m.144557 g.144557  ORF g.144557 m.144557 type:complete len:221 (-) comp16200_c0_seq2:1315-1977(-)